MPGFKKPNGFIANGLWGSCQVDDQHDTFCVKRKQQQYSDNVCWIGVNSLFLSHQSNPWTTEVVRKGTGGKLGTPEAVASTQRFPESVPFTSEEQDVHTVRQVFFFAHSSWFACLQHSNKNTARTQRSLRNLIQICPFSLQVCFIQQILSGVFQFKRSKQAPRESESSRNHTRIGARRSVSTCTVKVRAKAPGGAR